MVYAHYAVPAGIDGRYSRFAATGVDLFFALSGYVFAPYFFGLRLDLRAHLVRRALRIWPVYALAVLVYTAMRWPQLPDSGVVLRHLFFVHTWESREVAFALNPAFWSLPPEVEFYLALPLLAVALARRWVWPFALSAALLVRIGLLAALPTDPTAVNWALRLHVHLPGVLCEFLVGVWAWRVVRDSPSGSARLRRGCTGLVLLVGLAVFASVSGSVPVTLDIWFERLLPVAAALGYGLTLSAIGAWPTGLAAGRGLCLTVGGWSFAIYLLHNAALDAVGRAVLGGPGWLRALLALALTLAAAALVHRTFEDPLRNLGRRWGRRWASRQSLD